MKNISLIPPRARAVVICAFAFLVTFVFALPAARAANLIANPGFENNPPPNFGNNIGWSIAPWIVGTGQSPNVVKVDGGSSYNYGSGGPKVDATAPGAGIPQHYLDITNGANKFYQTFKIEACSSAPEGTRAHVSFAGSFSGRDNRGGAATIQLLQGAGLTGAVIQTVTAVVAPGSSQNDPWITVSGTATLAFGSTFSYVVDMPDPMNFDNAVLTVDKSPCDPPPPELTGCYKDAKVDIKCNADGTYTLTLSSVGRPGDLVTLSSMTPGVTVSPPQQPWAATTSWTISGATAGQTIALMSNDTQVGGGEKPGADKCCSGEIKIVMPACPRKVGDVIVEKKVINKTRATNAVINSLVFPVSLTCTAPANRNVSFGLQNATSHAETGIAYGSTCSVTEATSTLPTPPAGVCGESGAAVWATPVITPASAIVSGAMTAFTVVNELDCKDKQDRIDLGIEKTGATTPAQQPFYTFDLKVTNVGAPIGNASAIVVTETVPPNMTFNTIGGAGWTCTPPGGPTGTVITCVYSGPPIPTGQVLAPIHIDATSTAGAPYPPVTNCATVGVTASSGYVDTNASNDKSCVTVTKRNACPAPMVPGPAQDQCVCPAPATIGPTPNMCICPNGQPMSAAGACAESPPPPPPACKPPLIPNAAGKCDCPDGAVLSGQECVKRHACKPPMTLNAAGECSCPRGMILRNGMCVRREVCRPPMIQNADGGCGCPDGTIQRGGRCIRPVVCSEPFVPNAAATACVCTPGTVRRGRTCVTPPPPPVCAPPAQLRRGVCRCPAGMQAVGESCIPRERKLPREEPDRRRERPDINPGDIIRVLPHIFPQGGGGRGGPVFPRGGGEPMRQ